MKIKGSKCNKQELPFNMKNYIECDKCKSVAFLRDVNLIKHGIRAEYYCRSCGNTHVITSII